MPLLWRSPRCRWSFRIRIQVHLPCLYLSMFGVEGESMNRCKLNSLFEKVYNSECVKRLIYILWVKGWHFCRSKYFVLFSFPLLSDRSTWKDTDCRLLSACIVFQRLFSLCISAGRVGNCSVPEQKSESIFCTKVRIQILYKSQNGLPEQKSEWTKVRMVYLNKSQNEQKSEWSTWTKVRMNKSQNDVPEQKSETIFCTKVRMTYMYESKNERNTLNFFLIKLRLYPA